jgi:hypothetical protein
MKVLTLNSSGKTEEQDISLGGVSLVEIELDFGSQPLNNKNFTINASVTSGSKVLVYPSPNDSSVGVGNDWEVDSAIFTAKCGNGSFLLSVNAQLSISGKRKVYYQII